jgi:hypothetical protein
VRVRADSDLADMCAGARGVDAPLPDRSSYHTVCASTMWMVVPSTPLGDTLMCPSPLSGAVATQNIFCSRAHAIWSSGMWSNTFILRGVSGF